jgi:hypothetical protein
VGRTHTYLGAGFMEPSVVLSDSGRIVDRRSMVCTGS